MRYLVVILFLFASGARAQDALWPGTGPWAEAVLDTLSLEAKVAQLFVTDAYASVRGDTPEERNRLADRVERFGVGGILFSTGDAERQAALTRSLQARSALPLLIAQDMEHGVGMRVEGTTAFPKAMALGATGEPGLAYALGRHVAEEARALGVHVNFAPVADVNNNPFNPIINIRSFGERPADVSAFATATLRGMQDGGLIATAKHFPGHGDTDIDSHAALPLLPFSRERLDAVELQPFREAIAAGVRSVMTGHLAVPAIEPDTTLPATLSPRVITDVLRDDLGFEGLVVTDGLDMGGITTGFGIGESAVRAVEAGADLLILVQDEWAAQAAILEAIRTGRLTESRIDASIRQILRAKEWLGLHRMKEHRRQPGSRALPIASLAPPDSSLLSRGRQLADRIARRSLTLLRNDRSLLPLDPERCALVLTLAGRRYDGDHAPFVEEVRRRLDPTTALHHRVLGPDADSLYLTYVAALAKRHDVVLVTTDHSVRRTHADGGVPEAQRALVEDIAALGKPVVLLSFENPYLPHEVDGPQVVVVTYDALPGTQRVVAEALFGATEFGGRLPVTTPGAYRYGDGLHLTPQTLRPMDPSDAGFDTGTLDRIDRTLRQAIDDRVFPGAVVAIGVGHQIAKMAGFGRYTYDADSKPVGTDAVFDLASLTKVVGTTLAAMVLYDEGRLDLDAPVARYLPTFGRGTMKATATVRHLLSHSAGHRPFHPFHREGPRSPDAIRAFIYDDPAQYPPGADTRYSDFDMIVLGDVIEAITGQPIDAFIRETITEPLGLRETGFRLPGTVDPRALPTETDPSFRQRTLQGEVHDEAASLLGGVAGHAGLFSTAPDLARIAFLLTNGGAAYGHRLFSPETIDLFTRRARPPGEFPAALGWIAMRPPDEGYSSGGHKMGPRAFGHTGFTGTSLWVDPESGLWVILLTNRTYPTRGESAIGRLRATIADLAVEAFEKGQPAWAVPGTSSLDPRYTGPISNRPD